MNKELDAARAAYDKSRIRVETLIEQEHERVGKPLLLKQVGKCFVYYNTYGVSDGMKRWPLYARIVGFNDKEMTFEAVEFQHTTRQEVKIGYRKQYNFDCRSHYSLPNGWQEISLAQYDRAKRSTLQLIERLFELGDNNDVA